MSGSFLRLRKALRPRDATGSVDAQLLEDFIQQRDEVAFESLVRSHGSMVLGVCQRILRDSHDAEEAFQATFLVLARKAPSIVPRENVANWLYGVARRTALKARGLKVKRRMMESQVSEMPEPEVVQPEIWSRIEPILDQELGRLPEKYRTPIVLCDLEGMTQKEAAIQMGWTVGSLSMRLTRARRMLAQRLARRGFQVTSVTIAVLMSQNSASASVSASLFASTVKSAGLFAAGQAAATNVTSTSVTALADGVLKSMFLTTTAKAIGLLTLVAALGIGAAGLAGLMHVVAPTTVASALEVSREGGESKAAELALRAHAQAAAIDKLPRLIILARAGSWGPAPLANAAADLLQNLRRALDEPIVAKDWWYRETTYAWDEKHFLTGQRAQHAYLPSQVAANNNPPTSNFHWGTRELAGIRGQFGDQLPHLVLLANSAALWKQIVLATPSYLQTTSHEFWWGKNDSNSQQFATVPPEHSDYRTLNPEEFDGEPCHVVQSPTRLERLWISRKTGLIRGYLNFTFDRPRLDFYKSDTVRKIAGRSFAVEQDYVDWYRNELEKLPAAAELKWQLEKAYVDSMDFETNASPTLLVRFRDFKQIAPGVWWPYQEDRAQQGLNDGVRILVRTNSVVKETRTDRDLTAEVDALRPRQGERVRDLRYAAPVEYVYGPEVTETEILKLVDASVQNQQENDDVLKRLRQPIEKMVGNSAPTLPKTGWIGGAQPNVTGKPYLLHFWATWCGPCKNELPTLQKMADEGALIIGMHPPGTATAAIEKVLKERELSYPTFVESAGSAVLVGRIIAGYPADIFPYCILVDAQGKVVAHGGLLENDSQIIREFAALRKKSTRK